MEALQLHTEEHQAKWGRRVRLDGDRGWNTDEMVDWYKRVGFQDD